MQKDSLITETNKILRLLAENKNVLLTGAPATGKTTLLNLVAESFEERGRTEVDPYGPAAFPDCSDGDCSAFPGGNCDKRKVFRTTFHQGTKYRDFVRGLEPNPDKEGVQFMVSRGTLYQASEYAKQDNSAALVIIDEINRGPAVGVFGDMISSFEADKRLGDDGRPVKGKTVTVQIMGDDAQLVDYQLPSHLYFLAAMNQADSSVEPMDTAFMRRWRQEKLLPSVETLCEYFGIQSSGNGLKPEPESAGDVYAATVAALVCINHKISLGRGEDYEIGHGVFMRLEAKDVPQDTDGSLRYIADCWPLVEAHIEEVFYGDKEAVADVLNAHDGAFYTVQQETFAGRQVLSIDSEAVTEGNVYSMLCSLAAQS